MKKISAIKLDKETRDILTDQEKIKMLTQSEGWAIVEALFVKEAAKLLNMAEVNLQQPIGGNIVTEIAMRQLASGRILSILNDIKGTAHQYDMNSALTEQIENGYVLRR